MLQISDCDVGLTINGTNYEFQDVDSLNTVDPKEVHLIRGMNGTNKKGIAITSGLDQPFVTTTTLKNVTNELFEVMKSAHSDKTRVDLWTINRITGESLFYTDSLISKEPIQESISSDAESVTVSLIIESFNRKDKRKD